MSRKCLSFSKHAVFTQLTFVTIVNIQVLWGGSEDLVKQKLPLSLC